MLGCPGVVSGLRAYGGGGYGDRDGTSNPVPAQDDGRQASPELAAVRARRRGREAWAEQSGNMLEDKVPMLYSLSPDWRVVVEDGAMGLTYQRM